MPYTRGTFLGASVRAIRSGIGWNMGSPSELIVDLVEDPLNGDVFSPVDIGTPCFFEFYSFKFAGLLQKTVARKSSDGNPVYEVTLIDPREILDGAQVIISNYNGSVGAVKNLINVYGFWENQAFGTAEWNESGMPWRKIVAGLTTVVNQPSYTGFGGPLTYRGVVYSLNLNEMPIMPVDYRIGGISTSILELIAQVCDDAGFDFFIELDGYTIKVRTVSRVNAPQLGTINNLISNSYNNTVVRAEVGLEERNEVTSSFLVGGDVTLLEMTDSLVQFWGYDLVGNPITSVDGTLKLYGRAENGQDPPLLDEIAVQYMALNATPVADVIGSVSYLSNTAEMRFAQAGIRAWSAYIANQNPTLAQAIGLFSPIKGPVVGALQNNTPKVLINDTKANIQNAALAQDAYDKQYRLYQFVKGYADEYMGKKFLVELPSILNHLEEETLRTVSSYDITDAAYLPDGSAPLGISSLNEEIFKTQDGRFRCFARFDNLTDVDYSKISPKGTVLENGYLYMECSVEPRIVYTAADVPAAVVTISGPVVNQPEDMLGGIELVGAFLHLNPAEAQILAQGMGAHTTVGVRMAPLTRNPNIIAVPLRSNISTYGPWYVVGAPGKVRFEQDSSLVPWNYGGYTAMNLVGNAKVLNSVTNAQVSEAGVIELSSPPIASLGDVLQAGGPNITNISISFGQNGVSTSYRFQTFTPKFGIFGKSYSDKIKRLSLTNANIRKTAIDSIKRVNLINEVVGEASRASKNFLDDAHKAITKKTPHDILMSHSILDSGKYPTGMVNVGISSCETEDALSLLNVDSDAKFQATGGMGINGLLRPFKTNYTRTSVLPAYTQPEINGFLSQDTLNPWCNPNDIDFYVYGNTYTGFNALLNDGDNTNARPLALRGPLVVCGWGYDTDGHAAPNQYETIGSGSLTSFADNVLIRSDLWKVGPVDLLWDKHRGVWTCHDALKGTIIQNAVAGSSGLMLVQNTRNSTTWDLPVYNWFGSDVGSGIKVICNYIPTDDRWYIVAADCT